MSSNFLVNSQWSKSLLLTLSQTKCYVVIKMNVSCVYKAAVKTTRNLFIFDFIITKMSEQQLHETF